MNFPSAGIDGWPSKGCFCLVVNIVLVDMVFSLISVDTMIPRFSGGVPFIWWDMSILD